MHNFPTYLLNKCKWRRYNVLLLWTFDLLHFQIFIAQHTVHWKNLFDFSPLCVFKCFLKLHELLCSSKYCDWIHWPCPQHSPRAHIKHKQFIKNIIVGVGNPDDWWTLDCPPQNCPLGGNPEVGNPESISHQDCPPQLLFFLCSICAWYGSWVNAGDHASVFNHNILKNKVIHAISGDIWKRTVEKSQTNATNVTMYSLGQAIWGLVWKHTVRQPNKCRQCDFISNQAGDLRRYLKTHSEKKSNKCNPCD